jgi:hypothetical protein
MDNRSPGSVGAFLQAPQKERPAEAGQKVGASLLAGINLLTHRKPLIRSSLFVPSDSRFVVGAAIAMCSDCLRGLQTVGHNAIRGSGHPGQMPAFNDATAQAAGSTGAEPSSRVAKYSLMARLAPWGSRALFHSEPGIDRCLLASATIRLASTANPPAASFLTSAIATLSISARSDM